MWETFMLLLELTVSSFSIRLNPKNAVVPWIIIDNSTT